MWWTFGEVLRVACLNPCISSSNEDIQAWRLVGWQWDNETPCWIIRSKVSFAMRLPSCSEGIYPDNKVHGANVGLTCVLWTPDGPPVGLMNLATREVYFGYIHAIRTTFNQVVSQCAHWEITYAFKNGEIEWMIYFSEYIPTQTQMLFNNICMSWKKIIDIASFFVWSQNNGWHYTIILALYIVHYVRLETGQILTRK